MFNYKQKTVETVEKTDGKPLDTGLKSGANEKNRLLHTAE